MPRSYSMKGVQGAADRAVALVRTLACTIDPASRVHDVQADPRFQHRGVDLLWEREGRPVQGLEVKGDRQGRRGNYFFELISNLEKDTPGCFLYTVADAYAYVFLDLEEIHLLPMPATREWFLRRAKDFPLRHTRTKTGNVTYTTVGALVPITQLMREVTGAERHRLFEPAPKKKERSTHVRREHSR